MTLTSDVANLKAAYDVIVIGSGYGGAICAARLAEAGRRVCLLERGREWKLGEFPDTAKGCALNLRHAENPLGLFDYRPGDDLDVLVGSGVGGTSLINANVVIEPEDDVFQRERWPQGIQRAARDGELARFGSQFMDMIRPTDAGPAEGWPRKVSAQQKSAAHTQAGFSKLKIAVNLREFDDQANHAGVRQKLCTQCGDCVTGCNVGAKNTLAMNYLPWAKRHGAEIFAGKEVLYLEPAHEGGYHVFFSDLQADGHPARSVYAKCVVVSAGALGSTGILLRSAARGLELSWRLGHHVSGNADQLGFGYNNDIPTDTLGFGAHDDERAHIKVGPTIMSMLDFRADRPHDERFIIEEGAIPRAFVDAFRGIGAVLEHFGGQDTDKGIMDKLGELGRAARDWLAYDTKGAANHSMVYLGMGHDGSDGRIVLDEKGNPKLLWGAVPDREVFRKISAKMYAAVEALGGTYVENPRWNRSLGHNLITVHPLGGCPMGDDLNSGVVNEFGEAFDSAQGATDVHVGLFVADGSVLPESVGVNPLYTISVLAERIASHIRSREELRLSAAPPPAPALRPAPVGLQFTEEMRGFMTPNVTTAASPEQYREAAAEGQREGNTVSFRLTMLVENLERFIDEKEHEARTEGVVDSSLYGASRRVERGRFNLFVNTNVPGMKNMLYRLHFTGDDGKRYTLDGFKVVRDDQGLDVWADNTTLYSSIREGWSDQGKVLAQGVLYINVDGFLALLKSMKLSQSPSPEATLENTTRFGRLFLGTLWDTYVAPKWTELTGN